MGVRGCARRARRARRRSGDGRPLHSVGGNAAPDGPRDLQGLVAPRVREGREPGGHTGRLREGVPQAMRPLGVLLVIFAALWALLAPAPGIAAPPADSHLVITTLSTAPDRVSSGDVLVRVDVPANTPLADMRVALNGADVTGVFLPDGSSHALVGLVTGLRAGDNVLTAVTRRTKPSLNARLDVRNFPISGPVFSGPHQVPWICHTAASGP